MHRPRGRPAAADRVSIRTRSFDRVMRPDRGGGFDLFARFNPHPVFRPGDAVVAISFSNGQQVSIRTRSFDRVMRLPRAGGLHRARFNPHPVFRPGDARLSSAHGAADRSFNPHPVFRPGDAPPRKLAVSGAKFVGAARTRSGEPEEFTRGTRGAQVLTVISKNKVAREPAGKTTVASGSRTRLTEPTAPRSPPPGTRRTASPAGGPIR